MIVFKLKHPWRWRIWLLCCPIWGLMFICAIAGGIVGDTLRVLEDQCLRRLDATAEWCKEHEYVEED